MHAAFFFSGIFLGCSRYPECNGLVTWNRLREWRRGHRGRARASPCLLFELETPETFRLHSGECAKSGELIKKLIPCVVLQAAKLLRQRILSHSESASHSEAPVTDGKAALEPYDIPFDLRPLSWLPRGDFIREDSSLLRRFTSAAVVHARRVSETFHTTQMCVCHVDEIDESFKALDDCRSKQERSRFHQDETTDVHRWNGNATGPLTHGGARLLSGDRSSGGASVPEIGSEACVVEQKPCSHSGLQNSNTKCQFVDWTTGLLEAPDDGLPYWGGCVFSLKVYPEILQAAVTLLGSVRISPIPSLTLRFFRNYWSSGRWLVASKPVSKVLLAGQFGFH